ncbi:MAG: deoxyguanosinetriphosphate triphosphohydrolase, partial [Rhabdaerophilum sp.]
KWPGLEASRFAHEIMRRVITRLVEDAGQEAERRIVRLKPRSANDVRHAPLPVIAFSGRMAREEKALKAFLFERMYRAPRVMVMREQAERILRALFQRYMADPAAMGAAEGEVARPRAIADYIAGMTDRFALAEFQRLFDETPPLR